MVNKLDIRLSRNKVKDLQRKDLEDQFMEVQEEACDLIEKITQKDQEIKELKEKLKKVVDAQKTQEVKQKANEPSSKQPEWDKDGNPLSGKSKKKKTGGFRKGSGKKRKNLTPTEENTTSLDSCPDCGEDLEDQPVLETRSRIVEDIPEVQEVLVSKEITERKWCPICYKIVSSQSDRALPSSAYGLSTLILCAYLWVVTAISLPNISRYLTHFLVWFFRLQVFRK